MNAQTRISFQAASKLQLPVLLRALGDEVKALQNYYAHGLVTQEQAEERLADWELIYPPGWWNIVLMVDARRHQRVLEVERIVQPRIMAELAE